MKVYEAVAHACRHAGTDVAFGLVGDGNVKFVHHWTHACAGRYLAARHEAGAVSMAAGYARASGRVGLATVTQGPGVTNALTALTAAAKGRIPLVLFAGLPATTVPGHPQAVDQDALLAVTGAAPHPVSAESVVADVAAAFVRARTERRPVGICIPTDVQDAEIRAVRDFGADGEVPLDGALRGSSGVAPPDAAAIRTAADHAEASRRPLVVAGRGVLGSPGARQALLRLGERLGALMATTLPVRGFFTGAPFDIGVMGGFAPELTRAEIAGADCVLVFGASLNYRSTQSGALLDPDAIVVQCDVAADPAGGSVAVDHRVVGDAAVVADALTAELAARGVQRTGARTDELARRLATGDVHEPSGDHDGACLDPRALMLRLDETLPEERSVTVDGGHSSGWPSIYLGVPDHRGYLFSLEFAAIGLGLGTAVGAAVARPDRLSVLVVGDGALMMSLPDLETAVRHRVPLLVVVMNDGAYGSELAILSASGLPPDVGLFDNPSFAAVAEGLGAVGLTVRSIEEAGGIGAGLEGLEGPLVVDCHIDPSVRGAWLKGAFDRSLAVR